MKESIPVFQRIRALVALRFAVLIGTVLLVGPTSVWAAFNVIQTSADSVVAALVPSSSGLTTSGISFVGDNAQRGIFTASASDNIGGVNSLTSGAILSSGDVVDALGPNDSTGTSNNPYSESFSDPTLESFTGQSSADVSSITFTVTNPTAEPARVALRYTFASEEYPEYVQDLFNDGAYITIDGNVVSSVEIQTANFNDNQNSQAWEYDGYTDVATVVIGIPSAGSKVVRILVGDCRDIGFDSAFLIQSEITFGTVPDVAVYCAATWGGQLEQVIGVTEETYPSPFFVFQRSGGDVGSPLTVDFTLHYTTDIDDPSQAIWGQDYFVDDATATQLGSNWFSPWRTTFAPNETEAWVMINVMDDPYAEIEEFIVARPSPSASYTSPPQNQPGSEATIGIAGPGPDTQ